MLAILARRSGARVREVRVRHFARRAGQQSLAGLLTWARIGRRCVRELLALRLAAGRRPVPAVARLRGQPSLPR
jgi:hypothetical protein